MTTGLLTALERLILPNACVACGRLVEARDPDGLLCDVCRSRLRAPDAGCDRCGQPLPPVGPCRFCAGWPHSLVTARSAVWLGPEARAAVHHLKYAGYPALARWMAEVTVARVSRPADAVLIPIPLAPSRQRRRGYNQAAVFARALGDLWRVPVDGAHLRRIRATGTQTALSSQERQANIAGAFEALPPRVPGRTAVLIDDVLTTGATLTAAAAALCAAGWRRQAAITFARALPFEIKVSV